jgi:hypothetical protein
MVTRCSNTVADTLEYTCLRDPALLQVDHEIVAGLCQASASRAHAHLYVVGCIEYQHGDLKGYSRRLCLSARQHFLSEICDFVRALMELSSKCRKYILFAIRCSRARSCAGTHVVRTPRIVNRYFPKSATQQLCVSQLLVID